MSGIPSTNGRRSPADVTELRHEIEQTRTDLGHTVEALAAKADVKARAHEAVADAKARAHEAVADATARAREGVSHAGHTIGHAAGQAVDQAKVGARSGLDRLVRSVREHPAPWVAGTALILLAAAVVPNRERLAGTLAGPRSRRLATRRLVRARGPFSGSRRWWR